jgi:hypothetical protein
MEDVGLSSLTNVSKVYVRKGNSIRTPGVWVLITLVRQTGLVPTQELVTRS